MLRRAILLTLSLGASSAPVAADFTVTRMDDPSPNGCLAADCSLREAVVAANKLPGRDRIRLGAGTFNLTRLANGVQNDARVGPLWISDDTDLVGVGAAINQTHIRWSANVTADSPVFRAWNPDGNSLAVRWSAMKVSHGRNLPYGSGGCFFLSETYSTYTLQAVVVRDCMAGLGGAISASQSTLVLVKSTIESNHATNAGGGIHQGFDSTLITAASRIRSNTTEGSGGGVAFVHRFLSAATTTYWTDDGNSTVTDNRADINGGGLIVSGDTSLVLDGGDDWGNDRLVFSGNEAGNAGGGIHRDTRFVALVPPRMDVRRVSIGSNTAPSGAGVYAVLPTTLDQVELSGNSMATQVAPGNGGGLYLDVAAADGSVEISRSSFSSNGAGTLSGGAIYSAGCAPVSLANVSMHGNTAARGAAIASHGAIDFTHVTAIGNTGTSEEVYRYRSALSNCDDGDSVIANSVIADRCTTQHASGGGNQYGPDAGRCVASSTDQRQASDAVFALSPDTYGGAFAVMGWNADGTVRPQRDFGLAANCLVDDVRGLPRNDGFCDAGAFEQQP